MWQFDKIKDFFVIFSGLVSDVRRIGCYRFFSVWGDLSAWALWHFQKILNQKAENIDN